MRQYDLIVIGFGKAGKTLAKFMAQQGNKVAVIEQSRRMYGGTCINIGCIPSKILIHDSMTHMTFNQAVARKDQVTGLLNKKNYHKLSGEDNVEVIDAKAQFKSNKEIELHFADHHKEIITAEYILINTGAVANIPSIDGIKESKHIYDSEGIMQLTEQPEHLVIVGGGYIALEFAASFGGFGTQVTVLERGSQILGREDAEVAELAIKDMEAQNVKFVLNTNTTGFEDNGDSVIVKTDQGDFEADAVLLATGRKPHTDLALENTDIELGARGEIKVNEYLETTVPGIYAAGDVTGGPQFTYISLDDFRIIKDGLVGERKRTTQNRGIIPYTVFITPAISIVGLTAVQAIEQGYEIMEGKVKVSSITCQTIENEGRGLFKSVVDKKTNQILGATLYGIKSEELINLIKFAMEQQTSYEVLRDALYTHPTIIESFNELFNVK
ncbi:dihydrolipoamide dehydrogenase [Macrococcus hajekii]|uniref:Dihydrolipoamide dehydrogenase n=1 Tax=Macrococcus hajekii TaxID=198482 RepID=A0A4R6BJS6_9STAP|nr:hypothiocyanous acid reductase MerA [Macrococcus hajekii]TDM01955.1 dihydrolipoamide dehydrogenase [Macrococcus hajekii]GGB08819.1 dihydrolipoamide dehydrogenase [Macrococcus hajekii]